MAHLQGQVFNASTIAGSLGISASSSTRYLDHLCDTLMVRRLEPHFVNLGKRLVKSPKVTKGFWQACDDLQLDAAFVVAPVAEGWAMKAPAQVISVMDIAQKLLA